MKRKYTIGSLFSQRGSFYDSKETTVPQLRISGKWLESMGFHIGDKVDVDCSEGQLVIRKIAGAAADSASA